jgi:hypothetical protein
VDDAQALAGLGMNVIVRVGKPLADLHDHVDGLAYGQAAADATAPFHDGLEIDAIHELHHDEVGVVGMADIEDLDDVGVLEEQRKPRLVQEHGDELRVLGQRGQDALDSDVLAETLQGFCDTLEDLRHSTGGNALCNSITTIRHQAGRQT